MKHDNILPGMRWMFRRGEDSMNVPRGKRWTAVLAMLLLAGGLARGAEPEYLFEDFSSGNLEGWAQYLAPSGQAGTFTVVDGECRMETGPSVAPTVFPATVGLYRDDLDWADCEISVDFSGWHLGTGHETNTLMGILARCTVHPDNTVSGLLLFALPEQSPGAGMSGTNAQIAFNVVERSGPSLVAATILPEAAFDPSLWYRLVLSAQGADVKGALYRQDKLDEPLAMVSAWDTVTAAWSGGFIILALDRAGLTGVGNFGAKLSVDNVFASPAEVQPALEQTKAILLRWPTWTSGYVLEQAVDPEGPWEGVPAQPTLTTTGLEVSVPVSDWQRYFRLRKP
jgi:hypothetical protein